MEEKKQDITLYQANPLTESRYEFSPTEKNAFYMVIRQVRKNYVEREPPRTEFENMKVQISTSDLVQITDKDHTERAERHSVRSVTRLSSSRTRKEIGFIVASSIKPDGWQRSKSMRWR